MRLRTDWDGRNAPAVAVVRSPASPCCSLGLLLTGGLYAGVRRRPDRRDGRARAAPSPRTARALRRPTATAERRGPRAPDGGTTSAPPCSASAPPPSTSRSATGPHAHGPAGPAGPRKQPQFTAGADRGAGGVRRQSGPRPGIPGRERLPRRRGLTARRRVERSPAAARTLPHQLLRCATTSPAPAARSPKGKYAPGAEQHDERPAHLRGHAHRPAEHAGLQRRQPLARGQARHHRLPVLAARSSRTSTAASRSVDSARSARACSSGSSASAA